MSKITIKDVPHMIKMWDEKVNNDNPEQVSAKSKIPKYWRCPDCGYSWSASPKARYDSSGKCPCHESNKVIRKGINDVLTLVKGLDTFLDENNNFDEIYIQGVDSKMLVNLKCDECGRSWSSTLKSQVKKDVDGGYIAAGCKHYETSIRKSSDIPFCTSVDKIIKFWDDKNPMDPATTRANSNESAHFICKKCGYDWTTGIRAQARGTGKCKCCELQLVTRKDITDVFTLVPDSKRYYDFNKNKEIDIYSIPLRNNKILIDWKCPNCGKEWKSPLAQRIIGKKGEYSFRGCQDCYIYSKERITPVSSVPKLIKQWDFKKNKGIDPNITSAYRDTPVNWKCKKCGYEWKANIRSRMSSEGFCPLCEGKNKPVVKDITDVLTLCPELIDIYDFEENAKRGIDIYKEGINSRKKAHFKCRKCGNEWDSPIYKRIKKNNGKYRLVDCSACSHGLYRKTPYSIEFPQLAEMYREDLNNMSLDSIRGSKAISLTYYHWECPNCGETFESTLNAMKESHKSPTKGCPFCSNTKLRKGESFADLHPDLMNEYDPNNAIDPYSVFPNNGDYVNWICKYCGHHWSATFALRHAGGGNCPVCNHSYVVPDKTSFAAVYPDYIKYWATTNERKANEVFYNSSEWFRFICPTCNEEHGAYIEDFVSNNSCPYCKGLKVNPQKTSLNALCPDIVRRWSPSNTISPDSIFPTSWEWAKWICDKCKGEYNARIKDVVNGTDECPYCKGTKVLSGFNSFGDKHSDLIDEMDEIANYLLPISPYEVLDTSDYKFWFICKRNSKHKYPMSPRTRLMFQKRDREPCLYCRGQRRKLNHFVSYK